MTRGFSSGVFLLSAIAILVFTPAPLLGAQSARLPDGPAVGASIDQFLYEGERLTAVSFRFSGLRAGKLGSEIGVGLFPDALSSGALYLAPDLGPAFNASGPGFSLLLKGGLSSLAALGGGFAFIPGYHVGGGLIVQAGKRFGIRIDAVRHVYLAGEGSEALWSVGLGFTGLPRRAN
ncbi:MAG TPA: hypothetical protein VFX42_00265 [Gemmatimonadales bacterium]|nr:hypothetical protein [Gemmatimonadales bacterium]